jgi:hypothetical protein
MISIKDQPHYTRYIKIKVKEEACARKTVIFKIIKYKRIC